MKQVKLFIKSHVPQLVGLNFIMVVVVLVLVARLYVRQSVILDNSDHALKNQELIKENQLEHKQEIVKDVEVLNAKLDEYSKK